MKFFEDLATLNDNQLVIFFEAATIPNPPIGHLDRLLDKLRETPHRFLWSDGAKAVETISSIIKEGQRIIFVQYDVGRQVNFRMELIEKLNARSLDNFIDPIASANGEGVTGIVGARLTNLSQIWEAKRGPFLIIGSSRESNNLFAEPILEMPINKKEDLLKIQLPEGAPAIWQRLQCSSYESSSYENSARGRERFNRLSRDIGTGYTSNRVYRFLTICMEICKSA